MAGRRFDGRVALVTGAAGGIGAALAKRLIAEGASVVAGDIDVEGVERLARSDGDGRLLPVRLDVTSEESCADLARAIDKAHGRLDILVNNAGSYPAQRFEEISYEEWRRVVAVNLDSAFLVTRAVLPAMKRQGRGRVINISSGAVLLGTPLFTHYAAAKAGIIGLTRCLAAELGEYGITANVVSPGLTSTETVRRSLPPELLELRRQQRRVKRHQYAEDVVGTILFLASGDADLITGQTINVDGGVALH